MHDALHLFYVGAIFYRTMAERKTKRKNCSARVLVFFLNASTKVSTHPASRYRRAVARLKLIYDIDRKKYQIANTLRGPCCSPELRGDVYVRRIKISRSCSLSLSLFSTTNRYHPQFPVNQVALLNRNSVARTSHKPRPAKINSFATAEFQPRIPTVNILSHYHYLLLLLLYLLLIFLLIVLLLLLLLLIQQGQKTTVNDKSLNAGKRINLAIWKLPETTEPRGD